MLRRGRITLIATGCAAVLGAMLLIPGGDPQIAVADVPSITSTTSHETIAAIDAMLAPSLPEPPLQRRTRPALAAPTPEPEPVQTAAIDAIDSPADIEAPAADPDLTPDAIGASAVNLRAGPSSDTSTITVLQPGQAVRTGANDGGWVEVTLPDGTSGWVYSRYLASVAAAAPPEPAPEKVKPAQTAQATVPTATDQLEGRTVRVGAGVEARSIPSSHARTIFRTQPGERVKVVGVRGKWLHIVTADGSSGWIKAS